MAGQNENGTTGAGQAVTFEQAWVIAQQALLEQDPDGRMAFIRKMTQERLFGWVFFYTTRAYLESGDPGDLVPGNGPIVVYRHDGSTEFLSTSLPPEFAIEDVEARWKATHMAPAK
jgi:hypothetical protein